ncbi:unnamed protein product [Allacma fusca]|uniref:Uncharacterized protein n=1 Tax=Allacma fusca TaxID=39272 RepID=A0A8J2NY05_9HEXA|nr:unnamed protein product [Allacma fusca]
MESLRIRKNEVQRASSKSTGTVPGTRVTSSLKNKFNLNIGTPTNLQTDIPLAHNVSVGRLVTSKFKSLDVIKSCRESEAAEITNLPILQANEKFLVKFFTKNPSQLIHSDLLNVLVHLNSQAFNNLVFKNLTSFYSKFRNPGNEGAKSVFANLNRVTRNLFKINTNEVCTPNEKCTL